MEDKVEEYELPELKLLSPLQKFFLVCLKDYKDLHKDESEWFKSVRVMMYAFENLYYEYPDIRSYISAVAEMVHRPPYFVEGLGNWGEMDTDHCGQTYFKEYPALLIYTELRLSEAGEEYLLMHKKEVKQLREKMRAMKLSGPTYQILVGYTGKKPGRRRDK